MNAQPQDNGTQKTALEMRPIDIERGERLLFRLTEFGRILWEVGINVGPGQMLDLAETLSYVDPTSKEEFYDTLKCCLVTKHEQEPIFNQMFEYYWYVRDKPDKKKDDKKGAAKRQDRQLRLPPSERKRLAEHMISSELKRETSPELRMFIKRSTQVVDKREDDLVTPQGTAYSSLE
jgi:uncharacterized protein